MGQTSLFVEKRFDPFGFSADTCSPKRDDRSRFATAKWWRIVAGGKRIATTGIPIDATADRGAVAQCPRIFDPFRVNASRVACLPGVSLR